MPYNTAAACPQVCRLEATSMTETCLCLEGADLQGDVDLAVVYRQLLCWLLHCCATDRVHLSRLHHAVKAGASVREGAPASQQLEGCDCGVSNDACAQSVHAADTLNNTAVKDSARVFATV